MPVVLARHGLPVAQLGSSLGAPTRVPRGHVGVVAELRGEALRPCDEKTVLLRLGRPLVAARSPRRVLKLKSSNARMGTGASAQARSGDLRGAL